MARYVAFAVSYGMSSSQGLRQAVAGAALLMLRRLLFLTPRCLHIFAVDYAIDCCMPLCRAVDRVRRDAFMPRHDSIIRCADAPPAATPDAELHARFCRAIYVLFMPC